MVQTEKKVFAEQEEKDNAVRMRTNLSIPLLPEKEEDKKLAALLTYQTPDCKHYSVYRCFNTVEKISIERIKTTSESIKEVMCV